MLKKNSNFCKKMKKIFPFFFFIFCALLLARKYSSQSVCDEWFKAHMFNSTEFHVRGKDSYFTFMRIDSLQDLNVPMSCRRFKVEPLVLKIFINNEKLLIDNDLDLTNVMRIVAPKEDFFFQNVKGFNQKNIRAIVNKYNKYGRIHFDGWFNFFNANFDFYEYGKLLDEAKCTKENFDRNVTSFFGNMEQINFYDDVFYNNKVCPYVFMNTKLQSLELNQITNSLLFKNRLEFVRLDGENDLGTNLLKFYFMHIAYETVSLKNVDKHVFKKYALSILYQYC